MGNGAVLEKPVCKNGININIDIDAELEKIGVGLQVKVNGLLVKWKSNGYIPLLSGAEKAEIRLICGKDIRGFNVALGKNKDVIGAKNYSQSDDRNIYHKTIHIEDGVKTDYPVNCIRLCRRDKFSPHKFKVIEIGIVFQGRDGYLTVQDVYEGICYQDKDNNLVCPSFEKWPSLIEFLRQIQAQGDFFGKLHPLTTYRPPLLPKKKTFRGPKVGYVKFFNITSGFGVIEAISGDVYVDPESIISATKPLFLPKGAEVVFKNLIPSDKDKGAFKRKAIGVRTIG